MRYLVLFERFQEGGTEKPLSKKQLKRLRYSKRLSNVIVPFELLDKYGIPEEIREMMSTWDVINKSGYSDSFYSSTDIGWGHKPDKSFRVSDHWNFHTHGKWHCRTKEKVKNTSHISIGQYDAEIDKYRIILSLPTNKEREKQNDNKIRLKHLKDPETIYKKVQFKNRILNKDLLIKINYDGKDYEGVVRKYTGRELKIEDDKGELIFGENDIESSKIRKLELSDRSGNKVEDTFLGSGIYY